MLDFVNKPIMDLIKYMAEITGRNFIPTDDIKGEITIISHKPVSVPAAYEAFLSALEQTGYTTVTVGNVTKVVSSGTAGKTPIRVHQNGNIPFTDNFVDSGHRARERIGRRHLQCRQGADEQGRQCHQLRTREHPHPHGCCDQHPEDLQDHQPARHCCTEVKAGMSFL